MKHFTISEHSKVLCPIADRNGPTNATAGRLLSREGECSPNNHFDIKW